MNQRKPIARPYVAVVFLFAPIEFEYVYKDIVREDVNCRATYMAPISNRRGSYIKDVRRADRGSSSENFSSPHFPISEPTTRTNGPEELDESSLAKLLMSEEAGRFLGRLCEAGSVTWELGDMVSGEYSGLERSASEVGVQGES